jgi:multidrug transporter EmrE-like cation transporter
MGISRAFSMGSDITNGPDPTRRSQSMMQLKTILLILGAVSFSAMGQLFLKSGAQRLSSLGGTQFLFGAMRDVHVLSGLAVWAASTVCWLYVLRVAPLSRAYGLTSLTFVLIPIASVYVYGEQFRRVHAVGTVLIIIGVICLLSGESAPA